MLPRVAVVTACHSYEQYLPDAIASVREQSVPAGTHICVLDRVEYNLQGQYSDVVWLHNEREPGVAGARNEGAAWADANGYHWLTFLDEDDRLHLDYFRRMFQAADLVPEVGIWYPDWVSIGGNLGYHRTPEYSPEMLLAQPFLIVTNLVRTWIWRSIGGFDPQLEAQGLRWEDYLFFLEAMQIGVQMARCGQALVRVRSDGEGSRIANATIQQWRKVVSTKFKEKYGKELWT